MDMYYKGCTGCALFYEEAMSKAEELYKESSDIIFVSVCTDADMAMWKEMVKSKKYTSPDAGNILNLYTNGTGRKDALLEHYSINMYPLPVLIDKKGRIFDFSDKLTDKEYLMARISAALKQAD